MPSAFNSSLISPDGSRQVVLMVTRDANTWTDQIWDDYLAALLTAFCGQAPSPAAAQPLADTMARALPSLQRVR